MDSKRNKVTSSYRKVDVIRRRSSPEVSPWRLQRLSWDALLPPSSNTTLPLKKKKTHRCAEVPDNNAARSVVPFCRLLDVDSWWTRSEKFDVVSCLNLLDRCSDPAKLLVDMRNAVKPDGRLVVALVLPYRPFDEFSKLRTALKFQRYYPWGGGGEGKVLKSGMNKKKLREGGLKKI